MDLIGIQVATNRRNLKMTVLRREGGSWLEQEVTLLCNKLRTEVSQHPQHPEYLILFGHYAKEDTLRAIGGGVVYVATQVTGLQSEGVPFTPGFA